MANMRHQTRSTGLVGVSFQPFIAGGVRHVESCHREAINPNITDHRWPKELMEAIKKRLAGDIQVRRILMR